MSEAIQAKVFAPALSRSADWRKALEEVVLQARAGLQGKSASLVIFFVSQFYKDFDAEGFCRALNERLLPGVLVGCNSSGVIGSEREIEMEPAVSLLAMHLPGVRLHAFEVSGVQAHVMRNGEDLVNFLDVYPTDKPRFICLVDPASCDITKFLGTFNDGYRGLPVVGGLASGAAAGVPNWLCLNGEIYTEGAVGVAMIGDIRFDTLVSQGCRPIGQPFVMTKVEENILYELAGRPALLVLRELLGSLPPKDRALAEESLLVGLVMDEKKESFKRGDFLIRNIAGFDAQSGALAIGALLRVGQTLQFQLRDAETSAEDLEILLGGSAAKAASSRGGILVSCCGRGRNLYGEPDHDIRAIQSHRGPLPVTGFFASGEIGPVGEKNYVHGYTSSLVIVT